MAHKQLPPTRQRVLEPRRWQGHESVLDVVKPPIRTALQKGYVRTLLSHSTWWLEHWGIGVGDHHFLHWPLVSGVLEEGFLALDVLGC